MNDEKVLQQELSIMVSRILTTYVPVFAGLDTQWSIPHQYSAQSALKSEIVSDLKISTSISIRFHNMHVVGGGSRGLEPPTPPPPHFNSNS